MLKHSKAFTLLEILLVVAAIGILAAIVIVAINPNEQLAKVRDSERQSEVNTLYDAIQQYNIDNDGEWPGEVENMSANSAEEICADGVSDSSCINLTDDLSPEYVAAIPEDPQADGTGSDYVVIKDDANRITVEAILTEEKTQIIAAGGADILVLDRAPRAAVAYSLRKLNSDYSGNAIIIRRSSDNNTKNIGFDSDGTLNESAITNFIGSSEDAFVTTWYDQSGNENNATQTTDSNQPKIALNGAVTTASGRPSLDFDGAGDVMFTGYSLGDTFSHFLAGKETGGGNTRMISSENNNRIMTFNRSQVAFQNVGFSSAAVVEDTTGTPGTNFALGAMIVDTESRGYINGNDVTDNANRTGNTWGLLAIGSGQYNEHPTMRFSELITYDSNQTENRKAIESRINGYYDIY